LNVQMLGAPEQQRMQAPHLYSVDQAELTAQNNSCMQIRLFPTMRTKMSIHKLCSGRSIWGRPALISSWKHNTGLPACVLVANARTADRLQIKKTAGGPGIQACRTYPRIAYDAINASAKLAMISFAASPDNSQEFSFPVFMRRVHNHSIVRGLRSRIRPGSGLN
jgi:hypothetical protein